MTEVEKEVDAEKKEVEAAAEKKIEAAADKKEEGTKKIIRQIGKQLAASKTRRNKEFTIELIKQATKALEELKPPKLPIDSETLKRINQSRRESIKPLSDSLISQWLLHHKDKGVRLLVGVCLSEVVRVLVPDTGFSPTVSRDLFGLLLSIFEELDDIDSPYFEKRVRVLELVARLEFCVVMLDIGCGDLVTKMFRSFFFVVRKNHPKILFDSMALIITSILKEKMKEDGDDPERNTHQLLLDVVLLNIIKGKGVESASSRLAVCIIKTCHEKMEHCICICKFLTSCILNRDAVSSVVKESYHEIILEVYQVAPQKLLSVIPYLTHELLTDQVDVRIKAINLIRKLLELHGGNIAKEYPHIFIELLNRFSDKSSEVRLAALACAKSLYITNQSGRESLETLSFVQDRLLDHDDKVRMEAVNVVCELAKTNLDEESSDLVKKAVERLRDKKVSVRSKALKKLIEVYHEYCIRCAEESQETAPLNEHIEEIPCDFLMLCYEKDCQEFRPQSMELVFENLFPASLSIEERTRHWIFMFSRFMPPHLKALKTILSQKRRLHDGLKDYLDLFNIVEDNGSGETEKKMEALVVKMSSCFPDPAKAKDSFQKLKEFRDSGIFSVLQKFLSKGMTTDFDILKEVNLKKLGEHKALSEFLHILSKKCSFNIFGSEYVHYILDCLSSNKAKRKYMKNYQVQLLLTIISAFPSLLRGSEKQFKLLLLQTEIPFNEQLIEMFANEGYHLSIKLSDIYSFLEKVCLEGTRAQSKLAVSAIAALADASEQFYFSELCKTLVDSLRNGHNAPTVLQSLGCMAQHSVSAFESQEKVITSYIVDKIFQQNDAFVSKDETSNSCNSCKLKVFGLKALVRSFLPHKNTLQSRSIIFLLDILQNMLQNGGFSCSSIPCKHDEAFIRLAAAKSVLRLSRKWDLHISPKIFRLTILMAKDHSLTVRRTFISKIRKLLNNRAVPNRYACAFSFVALDSLEDLRSDALKYLEEFIRQYGKRVQIHDTATTQGATNNPAYLVVFLIHILAHDPSFPPPDCQDEMIYSQFMSPLFVTVQALLDGNLFDGDLHLKSCASIYLRSIFNAIKKVDDVEAEITPKLHLLAEVGLSILNSMNINIMPVTHTPASVMLPSSLFKSGSAEMKEANAYPSIGRKTGANFTKKLVSSLKTEVSRIGSVGTKHTQQFYENFVRPSGTRHSASSSKSRDTDELLKSKTKEQIAELQTGEKKQFDQCEVGISGQENVAMSLNHGSVALHNKFQIEDKHERDAPRNSGSDPSLPQNEVDVGCSSEEDEISKSGSSCAEPSRLLRTDDQVDHFTSKELSMDDHRNDSGDSSVNDEEKILDACVDDSEQENSLKERDCVRKVSQAVKKTKRRDDVIGPSISDFDTNNNNTRRTRRQKV